MNNTKMIFKDGMWKYPSKEIAKIADYYRIWTNLKIFETKECKVTKQEYIDAWINSGKWSLRGKGIGDYTMWPSPTANPITINDCAVIPWTLEMTYRKPNSNKELARQRREEKLLYRAEKERLLAEMRLQRALRPENEPLPKKEPKKRSKTTPDSIRDKRRALTTFKILYKDKYVVGITEDEWVNLWSDELWANYGRKLGDNYVHINVPIGTIRPITINDVEMRTREPRQYDIRVRKCKPTITPRTHTLMKKVSEKLEEERLLRKDSPIQRRINELELVPYTNYKLYNLRTKKTVAYQFKAPYGQS